MFRCVDSDGDWTKPKKPRMSVYFLHVSVRKLRLMATGQSQKKTRVSAYSVLHGLTRKLRLMAAGRSWKNQGCQSSVYMF